MIFLLSDVVTDVAYAPDGTVVSKVTVPGGDFGIAADGGSILVACDSAAPKFDLYRFDETNAQVSSFSWTDGIAGVCPIYGSSSLIDTQDRVLILYATRPFESPVPLWGLPAHHLAARWFEANGTPLTDWFDAGPDPVGGNILARPLIGGGAAVRVGDTWVATIPSGKAQVDPAPAFLQAKKDARIVLGGKAYAMIPDPGTAGTVDVVAAGGQSCGALTATTAADALSLGKDGTLIDSTGADACTLTYYPQVLK
jgi:hypothetical protein